MRWASIFLLISLLWHYVVQSCWLLCKNSLHEYLSRLLLHAGKMSLPHVIFPVILSTLCWRISRYFARTYFWDCYWSSTNQSQVDWYNPEDLLQSVTKTTAQDGCGQDQKRAEILTLFPQPKSHLLFDHSVQYQIRWWSTAKFCRVLGDKTSPQMNGCLTNSHKVSV